MRWPAWKGRITTGGRNRRVLAFECQRLYRLLYTATQSTSLKSVGVVADTNGVHGAAVDPTSHHGFSSSNPVVMFDTNTLATIKTIQVKGSPDGILFDAKNHILFVCCRRPQTVVIMNAEDGKIITTLPIGNGVDAAEFNSATMEAFSSQRDGTLTVIKENSPTDFAIEQTVQTMQGAKTSTLDSKTNQIYLIAAETAPPAPGADQAGGRRGRGQMVPDSFTILVVGK